MTPASETIPDTVSCPDSSGDGRAAPQSPELRESFLWRQFSAAGLAAVAEKVAAGRDLELDEALALSRASLPLLGEIVKLRCVSKNAEEAALPNALRIERVATLPASPTCVGQPLADWESFCRTLIACRAGFSLPLREGGLKPTLQNRISWYPIVEQPLDRDLGCDSTITGVDVLRAIALARLVLPAAVQVWAPLATLGPKLAQVAMEFGASHLGYVAPEGQTPSNPLIADPSVLDELLGSCQPTCVKEES